MAVSAGATGGLPGFAISTKAMWAGVGVGCPVTGIQLEKLRAHRIAIK
jgi:hypothetical protein